MCNTRLPSRWSCLNLQSLSNLLNRRRLSTTVLVNSWPVACMTVRICHDFTDW